MCFVFLSIIYCDINNKPLETINGIFKPDIDVFNYNDLNKFIHSKLRNTYVCNIQIKLCGALSEKMVDFTHDALKYNQEGGEKLLHFEIRGYFTIKKEILKKEETIFEKIKSFFIYFSFY